MKSDEDKVVEMFLRESNAIEGVYDRRSLDDALKAWNYLIKQPEMTTAVVLTTHRLLMAHQPLEIINRGHYRKCKVWVGRREAMDWKDIPGAIDVWMRLMNKYAPVPTWKDLHVQYENIHPFVDGNGRTGRMFMNWYRVKKMNERIYVVKESDRAKYYAWFK